MFSNLSIHPIALYISQLPHSAKAAILKDKLDVYASILGWSYLKVLKCLVHDQEEGSVGIQGAARGRCTLLRCFRRLYGSVGGPFGLYQRSVFDRRLFIDSSPLLPSVPSVQEADDNQSELR